MHRNKRVVIIGSLLLVVAWGIWCAYFLPKGLDFTDEGMYCSEAWRFAHGDVPFRDSFAAWGLPLWWLSWVFRFYPECGLLGLRVVWASVMLLCALVTANLMLKYFNPVVSFAGAAVSLFFATSAAIKILSYNTMPILGLLLAAWLWLTACSRSGKVQLLLAGGAGIAVFLATSCRVSLLPIAVLPVLTMVYDRCCGIKMDGWLRATTAFLVAYIAGVACFLLVTSSTGLMSDFLATFVIHASCQGYSLKDMIHNLRDSSLYYLLPAIPILVLVFAVRFKKVVAFWKKHKKSIIYVVVPVLIAGIVIAVFNWDAVCEVSSWLKRDVDRLLPGPFATSSMVSGRQNVLFLLTLAIGVVLADIVFHVFDSNSEKGIGKTHDRYRLGIIALFLSFLMILGTSMAPAYSIRFMSWLPVSMAFGLLWLWIPEQTKQPVKASLVWVARAALVALILVCTYYVISPDRFPYRDGPVGELIAMPAATKLQGIYTTSERAHTVDRLVEAVEQNSEPGDRILAYENLPMLYYLTDRLPSTNPTWLTESFPRSLRQSVLEDMINRDRLPQLVIRATYTTRYLDWPRTQRPLYWKENEQETDPIDKYVSQHYRVIQEIDGFQVMLPVE